MLHILRAYTLALRSLLRPGVVAHLIWPPLVAAAAWLGIGYLCWEKLGVAAAAWLAHGNRPLAVSLKVALYLISLPFAQLTAVLILEIVALPFMLEHIARHDYPGLERRHGGTLRGSMRNTLVSFAIAAMATAITLPLWLLSGAGAVLSLALAAWLNYRAFRYDVLSSHADKAELIALPREHRMRLLLLALGCSLVTLIPIVNLLAVPLAGLCFAHYLLHALEGSRTPLRAAPTTSGPTES